MCVSIKPVVGICLSIVIAATACTGTNGVQGTENSFGDLFGETAQDQVRLQLQLETEVVELIEACMRREGFDVPPAVVSGTDFYQQADVLTDEEFVDRFGYGIAVIATSGVLGISEDPWVSFRNQLDDPERASFDTALNGPSGAERSGCVDEAQIRAMGGLIPMQIARVDIEEEIETDARYREIELSWVDCMVESGYKESLYFDWGRDEVGQRVSQQVAFAAAVLVSGEEVPIAALSGSDLVAEVRLPNEFAEVEQFERQVARVDYGCRRPLVDELSDVRRPYEAKFLEELGG